VFALVLITAALAGCGKQDESSRPTVPAGKGIVGGVVRFSGPLAKPQPIPGADCHLGGPVLMDESLAVDAGGLRNVIVYVKDGPPVDVPSGPVAMDQVNCRFSPHVVAVRTGQILQFHSSDPVPHNVRARCEANESFNFMMGSAGQSQDKTFAKPEFFQVHCDVHPWMNGWVGVFDHPLFAVTGDGGKFRIEHLPPGKYTLVAWQERLGTREQPLTVSDGPVTVNFEFGSP
jgi:plastocyanin